MGRKLKSRPRKRRDRRSSLSPYCRYQKTPHQYHGGGKKDEQKT
jgi:hypothetical protein